MKEVLVSGRVNRSPVKDHTGLYRKLGKERVRGQITWGFHGHRKRFGFYIRYDRKDSDEEKTQSDSMGCVNDKLKGGKSETLRSPWKKKMMAWTRVIVGWGEVVRF